MRLLWLGLFSTGSLSAGELYNLYFYSSESAINNYQSLKTEFDRFLQQKGAYQFQPFSDLATFEAFIAGKQDGVLMISQWHYERIAKKHQLVPLLVGTRDDKTTVSRILVGQKPARSQLKGVVATALSSTIARDILARMIGTHQTQALDFLQVPKDIDALMSVGFGMADYALATEDGLAQIAKLNPSLQQQLEVTAQGEKTLLLIVAIPNTQKNAAKHLLAVMESMAAENDGIKGMHMLGIDHWRQPGQIEIGLLKGQGQP